MLWLSALLLFLLALIFMWWAMQTAWLGSFPGRDIARYTLYFWFQLGIAVLLLLGSVLLIRRALRLKH
jgi:hypothetical protein